MMLPDYEIFIKLGFAVLFGFLIGLERELEHKPLGLKTCVVISVVSCLLTIVSIEAAYTFPKTDRIIMDPMRLAAQIVSGVGFLGAGVIMRRSNDVISGLTTAAMIWGAAGLGIAAGVGYYFQATLGLLCILIGVEVLPRIARKLGPKGLSETETQLIITLGYEADLSSVVQELRSRYRVRRIHVRDLDDGCHRLDLSMLVNRKKEITDIYMDVRSIQYVRTVELEAL